MYMIFKDGNVFQQRNVCIVCLLLTECVQILSAYVNCLKLILM